MEEILHHLTCTKPWRKWDIYHINWLAGFLLSAVACMEWKLCKIHLLGNLGSCLQRRHSLVEMLPSWHILTYGSHIQANGSQKLTLISNPLKHPHFPLTSIHVFHPLMKKITEKSGNFGVTLMGSRPGAGNRSDAPWDKHFKREAPAPTEPWWNNSGF